LCFNKLNFCYCYRFPMKHLLHFNKLWTFYHFMSIQTTNVACIWRCILWFFILLCCFYDCHYGLLLFSSCFDIVISHSTICAIFVNLSYITLCFWYCCLLSTLWYWKYFPCLIIPFSHNIVASLWCCGVDHFIFVVVILRYDYKPTLNTIGRKHGIMI
jgi:hypothetical protein